MKRKSTGSLFNKLNYRFPPVTLYLDDITKIIESLDKRGAKYSISDIEYNYDSLEDIKSNCGEFIKNLSITAQFDDLNYLTLEFERGAIILKFSKSDTTILIFNDIKEIIERRSSWYLRLINSQIFMFTGSLILIIVWTIKPDLVTASKPYWLEVVIFFSLYFLLISCLSNFLKPKIYFNNKQQVKGFFRENADKLIIAVVSALFGAFAKNIIDKIF